MVMALGALPTRATDSRNVGTLIEAARSGVAKSVVLRFALKGIAGCAPPACHAVIALRAS
jgi:hypothetical protein